MPRTRRQLAALKNCDYQLIPPKNDISLFQKSGNCIEGLPLSIFLLIRSYLTPIDYRDLMNCNLATFQPIKYETVEYTIIGPERWIHIDSVHDDLKERFIKTLINSVKDKSKQISMTMNQISVDLLTSSKDLFKGIHHVSVRLTPRALKEKAIDFHIFDNIHHVVLSSSQVINIDGGFENVVKLELNDLSRLQSITNINHNKTLRHLSLRNCASLQQLNIIFENIKVIRLECRRLSDFEGLCGDIENFTFRSSEQITLRTANSLAFIAPKLKYMLVCCNWPLEFQDFKDFQNITNLDLIGIHKIHSPTHSFPSTFEGTKLHVNAFNLTTWNRSMTRFDNLQTLEISTCIGLVDFPVIPSLTKLIINEVKNLQTIPTLMNLRELNISYCELVSIASIQPSLKEVKILRTPLLNSLSFESSPFIESVSLTRCPLITNVSFFRNVPKLFLNDCDGIRSLKGLEGFSLEEDRRHIELSNLKNCRDLSGLHQIHSLRMSSFFTEDLEGIHDINHLQISSCFNLLTTRGLANIHCSLLIHYCPKLSNLENLQGIPLITLTSISPQSFDGLKNEVPFGEVRISVKARDTGLIVSKQRELNIQKLVVTHSWSNEVKVYILE